MNTYFIVFGAIGFFLIGVFMTLEFSKDKEATDWIFVDDERYFVSPAVRKYIKKIKDKADYYKSLSDGYEKELREIKPILEVPGLKPAVSLYCKDCEYSLQSPYNNDVLACRKDVTCESFKNKYCTVR